MRNVIVGAFVSLDGVMQAPGGPEEDTSGGFKFGGWTFPYFDEAVGEVMGEIFSRPYALLLGRKTYDIFASYWPTAENGPDGETAKQFNAAAKYVATRSTASLAWKNSIALPNPAADVARLKQEDGPDLLIQGSSELIHVLQAHALIDEFHLLIFPVVLGTGKRLFDTQAKPGALKLTRSRASASGVTLNSYTPAGPVQTGSFADPR